jgi:hypothetical protein
MCVFHALRVGRKHTKCTYIYARVIAGQHTSCACQSSDADADGLRTNRRQSRDTQAETRRSRLREHDRHVQDMRMHVTSYTL